MFPLFYRVSAALVAFTAVAPLRAEPEIIARARAYLGAEADLDAVRSIHYSGTMSVANPADPTKPVMLSIDIVFQVPFRQRTVRTTDALVDTVALDTYEGWHRVQEVKDPTHWRLQVLATDQVKRQRAIVLENISFYRGLEREGGQVTDLGSTTVAGVVCRKIAFIHAPDIVYYRYFDATTGRLILTETEDGSTIREQGEIRAGGLRFPKVVINTSKLAGGKEQTVTIAFDSITVNEVFPDSTFAIPAFTAK